MNGALNKEGVRLWPGFIWHKTGPDGRLL